MEFDKKRLARQPSSDGQMNQNMAGMIQPFVWGFRTFIYIDSILGSTPKFRCTFPPLNLFRQPPSRLASNHWDNFISALVDSLAFVEELRTWRAGKRLMFSLDVRSSCRDGNILSSVLEKVGTAVFCDGTEFLSTSWPWSRCAVSADYKTFAPSLNWHGQPWEVPTCSRDSISFKDENGQLFKSTAKTKTAQDYWWVSSIR